MRDVEPEKNKTVGAALQQWRLKRSFHFVKACAALSGKSLQGQKKKKNCPVCPIWCFIPPTASSPLFSF